MKTTRRAAALGIVVAGLVAAGVVAADDKPEAKDPKADAGAKGDGDKPGARESKPDPAAKPPVAEEKVAAPESWPPRVGKPFPDLALPDQDGKITAEFARGYKFGERLLRPARVQVGKAA